MINKETPKLVDADFGKDPVSVSVMADFDRARSYVKNNYQTIWEDCFKEYNSIRTRRGYAGVADDFIPEIFSILKTMEICIMR